jgi:hypothetical protein
MKIETKRSLSSDSNSFHPSIMKPPQSTIHFISRLISATALGAMSLLLSANRLMALALTEFAPGIPTAPQECVVWGDYDGDGDVDVLVAGTGKHDVPFTTIYKNIGGTFSDSGIILQGLSRATAAWGDFDGDGDLDLAMTGLDINGVCTTRVYRNDGGVFTPVPGNFLGVFGGSVTWADYDGDGDLDLLITGITSTVAGVGVPVTRLYRNDGGVFTSVPHPFPNCYVGAVAWGDYNNDGRPDVVITGATDGGALVAAIWRNDGGGNFTDIGANLPGMDLGFVAWGDYDNDGDLDLLFGGNSNDGWITRIYRNNDGVFADVDAGLQGLLWSSGAWGDYDNDGRLDIMVIGYDAVAQVHRSILYHNDGGSFVDSGATFHNLILGTVSWVDFDNDGHLDLSLSGNENGLEVLSLYRNTTGTTNSAPSAPTNPVVNVNGTSVDFAWSAATDTQTPAAGLTYNLRVGTTPGGSQVVSSQSGTNGYRQLAALGNTGHRLGAHLGSLKPGTNYFWSVQAVDTAFAGSAFSAEGNFTALADRPVSLSIIRAGPGSIRATWSGTPGSTYHVLASTDLSAWTLFATPTVGTNGLFEIVDATASAPAKYYRAARP